MSACLAGKCCKYNGESNYAPSLLKKFQDDEIVLVCPEQLGGLPTPRTPCEKVGERILTKDGDDVTAQFLKGAQAALEQVKDCDLVILQKRSPSCGVHQVYDGTFSGRLVEGSGVFAQKVKMSNIPIMEAESEILE